MQKKCALQDVKNLQVTGVGSAPASNVDELLHEISVCITSSKIIPHVAFGQFPTFLIFLVEENWRQGLFTKRVVFQWMMAGCIYEENWRQGLFAGHVWDLEVLKICYLS